jgi:hypothetical protein
VKPGTYVTRGGNAVCHIVGGAPRPDHTVCGKPIAGMTVAHGGPSNFGGACKSCERMRGPGGAVRERGGR